MEIAQAVLSKLGFDWQVAIANLINFLIIYFLLKKFVFDKLADAISERRKKAEDNVALRNSLDEEKSAWDQLVKDKEQALRNERDILLTKAEKETQEILAEAGQEASLLKNQAVNQGEKEKQKIIDSVSEEIKDLSLSLSKKVLAAYQEKPDEAKLKSILDKESK